ncbi:MAG: DUF4190 domain-containing protein [Phycisphaerae bacterium]|jgi:hypothetical protein|nr:DUF4190 domain-containing protein [Phycisphaerae bacterium]
MNMIDELTVETNQTQRSGLATIAMVCSFIICCPITTIVGPILGVIALLTLRGKPQLTGKGFAWTAIVVGLISTIIWVGAGLFFGRMALKFIEQAGEVTTTTIQAGFDKDYTTFRAGLSQSSSDVTDEEIDQFITELESRYGTFDSAVMNMEEQQQGIKPTANEAPLPIRLLFETTDVPADVLMEVIPSGGFEFEFKLGCIRINDAKLGDLIFPKGSACDTAPEDPTKEESDEYRS